MSAECLGEGFAYAALSGTVPTASKNLIPGKNTRGDRVHNTITISFQNTWVPKKRGIHLFQRLQSVVFFAYHWYLPLYCTFATTASIITHDADFNTLERRYPLPALNIS